MSTAVRINPKHLIDFASVNNDAKHRRDGLQLPEDTLADLRRIADETGCKKGCRFDSLIKAY
ncbi:MAG TPA: hypothetical protein VFI62_15090 [Burkholderiales bacterium]|nr:hypothetical protein [Burkholderiales bacterium]